ncbi:MAG: serine/threonine-protein kinase [Pseudomonadota bacterium]
MNTPPPDQATNRRWWLDPALARLVFDAPPADSGALPISEVVGDAILQAAGFDAAPAFDQSADAGYELLDILGEGGMGVVYRARQRDLDREVALKMLSAGSRATRELVENLRREARHAGRLQHPNIVTVHGLGEHDGLICYAMQLVRGQSLAQRLDAHGPWTAHAAARLLLTLAEAVDYAHQLGVLHLDLKPGNILIDENDAPLIADFGLARTLELVAERRAGAGTPGYMAPEQVDEAFGSLGPGSDVWSLGVILYEVLTAHVPFEADTPADTVRLLLAGKLRHPSRYVAVPADLEAVCVKCLSKYPDLRYPTARALADDLSRFLKGREVSVRRLNPLQRFAHWCLREPRAALATAFAAFAVLLACLAVAWR